MHVRKRCESDIFIAALPAIFDTSVVDILLLKYKRQKKLRFIVKIFELVHCAWVFALKCCSLFLVQRIVSKIRPDG